MVYKSQMVVMKGYQKEMLRVLKNLWERTILKDLWRDEEITMDHKMDLKSEVMILLDKMTQRAERTLMDRQWGICLTLVL